MGCFETILVSHFGKQDAGLDQDLAFSCMALLLSFDYLIAFRQLLAWMKNLHASSQKEKAQLYIQTVYKLNILSI